MCGTKQWVYNFLIPLVFLVHQRSCTTAEDYYVEATDGPKPNIDALTTNSVFNGDSADNENFTGMRSKAIESDVQKSNSGTIYPAITHSHGHNHPQERVDFERDAGSRTFGANGSNDSKERVTSHKKSVHFTSQKHKMHHRNYRKYGHKSHKRNLSKYKKYENLKNRKKHDMQNIFNQQPYYQGQVSYYGDTNSGDEAIYLPAEVRGRRYHHRGHHVNRIDEYNRNSKWPHLSRVQYQLYEDEKEDDLPPYIRKYNRRNKQLLDLLEGTMPPILPAHPPKADATSGGRGGIVSKKREKTQHRYHNHKNPKWIMEDLFEEQKANPNNPNPDEDQYVNDSATPNVESSVSASADVSTALRSTELKLILQNELPGDDITSSSSSFSSSENHDQDDDGDKRPAKGDLQSNMMKIQEQTSPVTSITNPRDDLKFSPKGNKFIYHRVDAPRVVGAGIGGPKKQRLPFVAITDRRLETSKMRSKDFQQNHQPMP